LGSSLIPLFEENETSSPVASIAEPPPGKMIAFNESNAVAPTTSKTIKITADRARCSLVRDGLAPRFFEQPRRSDLVLGPVLEVDGELDGPTRWYILLRVHLEDTLLTSFGRGRVGNTPSLKAKGGLIGVAAHPG
jgi:hypothetical protein